MSRLSPGAAGRMFELLAATETDSCLLWTGARSSKGYGQLGVNGVSKSVHVLACTQRHGPRPEGHQVAHSCNTPACMNYRHLRWTTPRSNAEDSIKPGGWRHHALTGAAS